METFRSMPIIDSSLGYIMKKLYLEIMRPKFLQIPATQTEKRNKEDFTGILHKLLEFHNFYYFMTSD